jgi:hypothetical protein
MGRWPRVGLQRAAIARQRRRDAAQEPEKTASHGLDWSCATAPRLSRRTAVAPAAAARAIREQITFLGEPGQGK